MPPRSSNWNSRGSSPTRQEGLADRRRRSAAPASETLQSGVIAITAFKPSKLHQWLTQVWAVLPVAFPRAFTIKKTATLPPCSMEVCGSLKRGSLSRSIASKYAPTNFRVVSDPWAS